MTEKNREQVTVYADLNCPYCYVLNERLGQMDKPLTVRWLPVEHAPDLYEHSFTDQDRQDLIREVDDVRSKAPSFTLILPDTRPNSRYASMLLASIIREQPEKAVEFRTAVYRALWQQGSDISDADVLKQLLASTGLSDIQISESAENDLLDWHTAWELGHFARNIPSMESTAGYKLLGFPPLEQLEQFMEHGTASVTTFKDASCVSSDRYSIAVVSENKKNWSNPKLLEAISHYYYFLSASSLTEPGAAVRKLDMIVLDNPPEDSVIELIKTLKHSSFTQSIPIFLLSDDEGVQIEAYRSGVTDIAQTDINEEILGHRMVRMLRTKRSADKMFEIARIDSLTGLYNRREFDAALDREWRQIHREKTSLSLLIIDLDNFKAYNDTYGHSMGDEVLRRFARVLESCTNRPVDLVVRYGGEEFAVILPNVSIEGAMHVAELIRKQTEVHDIKHDASSTCSHITVSIGVAKVDATTKISLKQFVNCADEALYKAKKNGRNQVCAFS